MCCLLDSDEEVPLREAATLAVAVGEQSTDGRKDSCLSVVAGEAEKAGSPAAATSDFAETEAEM